MKIKNAIMLLSLAALLQAAPLNAAATVGPEAAKNQLLSNLRKQCEAVIDTFAKSNSITSFDSWITGFSGISANKDKLTTISDALKDGSTFWTRTDWTKKTDGSPNIPEEPLKKELREYIQLSLDKLTAAAAGSTPAITGGLNINANARIDTIADFLKLFDKATDAPTACTLWTNWLGSTASKGDKLKNLCYSNCCTILTNKTNYPETDFNSAFEKKYGALTSGTSWYNFFNRELTKINSLPEIKAINKLIALMVEKAPLFATTPPTGTPPTGTPPTGTPPTGTPPTGTPPTGT
ncbi:hypothetical protein K2W90_04260, partial [Candidatus Babeliales bacterium]|nr:hypothetical protein [Candidatus Babeliales bacterium]